MTWLWLLLLKRVRLAEQRACCCLLCLRSGPTQRWPASTLPHGLQVNDRYEFYDTIDLDREGGKYLAPGADRNLRNTYKLLAVLVHSGGVHGGHYFAFVR